MGGFGNGCGPCGFGNDYYDNNDYKSGYCGNNSNDNYVNSQNNTYAKKRQVYWENEDVYANNNSACCAKRDRNNFNNWKAGHKSRGGCSSGPGWGFRPFGGAPCSGLKRGMGYKC